MGTKVSVKWDKQMYRDVEVDMSAPLELFKTQLWTLTGVSPDRQTLMIKGKKLRDDTGWASVTLKPNTMVLMMGTTGELISEPAEKIVFAEDLDQDDPDALNQLVVKRGLQNFGNLCYVNSTVQCLNQIDELQPVLDQLKSSSSENNHPVQLAKALSSLLTSLDPSIPAPASGKPLALFNVLKTINPVFAEQNQMGMNKQQDAEECWSLILSQLAIALQNRGEEENPVDQMFGISMRETSTNQESTDEVLTVTTKHRLLRCHIGNKTSHLFEGLKESLEEDIERNSEVLGRDATFKQISKIEKLPGYLAVQMVRFRWKAAESVKAKILKSISFPFTFDVLDLCTEDLQAKLKVRRNEEIKKHDEAVARAQSQVDEVEAKTPEPEKPKDADETMDETASAAAGASANDGEATPEKPVNIITSETGVYELVGVLTHQGRIAESGHYVSWCKDKDGAWWQFDDEKVYQRTEEDIRKLTGGGDWHMAYMLLYKARNSYD
mmetsp:Transcript_9361/g.40673  ORF Transcript_9361/g.40673 Transcript_9361/m.40673 type:complete len:495 (-) Transcript_9361:259-1743(-)